LASGAFSDTGTVSLGLLFGAVPSPTLGVLQSDRTPTGRFG